MVKITDTDTVVLVKNNGEVSVLKIEIVKAVKAVYSEDSDTVLSPLGKWVITVLFRCGLQFVKFDHTGGFFPKRFCMFYFLQGGLKATFLTISPVCLQ